MTEPSRIDHAAWLQAVYGKRVLYDEGPIVPGFEHRCTSRSPELPKNVAVLCYPYVVGIGTNDLSNWRRYPWLESGQTRHSTGVAGGLTLQARCVDNTWWIIATRIRGRSEGAEGVRDNRYYVQACYLAKEVQHLGDWVLTDLPSALVARPDVQDAPNDRGPIEPPRWSAERDTLPADWFETVREWLFSLLCGRPVTVTDRGMHPDDFYFKAMQCLACLPGTTRWRVPIGAGLYPIDNDQIALGHGAEVKSPTSVEIDSKVKEKANVYLSWLSHLAPAITTLSKLVATVDQEFAQFAAWDSSPVTPGPLDWRKEMEFVRDLGDQLSRIEQISDYIHGGSAEIPSMSFLQFRRRIIDMVDKGLNRAEHNKRAGAVLVLILKQDWSTEWREEIDQRENFPHVLKGIASLFGYLEFQWEWLEELMQRVDLPAELDDHIQSVLTNQAIFGQADYKKVGALSRMVVRAYIGVAKPWFKKWLQKDPLLTRWLVYYAILNGRTVEKNTALLDIDLNVCHTVYGLLNNRPISAYSQLEPILKDINACSGKSAPVYSEFIKETAHCIAGHAYSQKLFVEGLILRRELNGRNDPVEVKQQSLDDIVKHFSKVREVGWIRGIIFREWSRISDKSGLEQQLDIPRPYDYILCQLSRFNGETSGSLSKLKESDRQFLNRVLADVGMSRLDDGGRFQEITDRALAVAVHDPQLRELICDSFREKIRSKKDLDCTQANVFIAHILQQESFDQLPKFDKKRAEDVQSFLGLLEPDPRSQTGLLPPVRSLGEMRAYLVGAAPNEGFPHLTDDVVLKALEDAAVNPTFWSAHLKRIGMQHEPMWRLLGINEDVPTSNLKYTSDELPVVSLYFKRKLKSKSKDISGWFIKFVEHGWPLPIINHPDEVDNEISSVFTVNALHQAVVCIEDNSGVAQFGMALVASCERSGTRRMASILLQFVLLRAKKEGLMKEHVKRLLYPDLWDDQIPAALKRAWLGPSIFFGTEILTIVIVLIVSRLGLGISPISNALLGPLIAGSIGLGLACFGACLGWALHANAKISGDGLDVFGPLLSRAHKLQSQYSADPEQHLNDAIKAVWSPVGRY